MPDTSSDNIQRPPMSAHTWWGETATKVFVAAVSTAVVGFGTWMWQINAKFADMTIQLVTITAKLDSMTEGLAAAKAGGIEAQAIARDNARRIDRIENTRFTDADATKLIAPLEHRLDRLEHHHEHAHHDHQHDQRVDPPAEDISVLAGLEHVVESESQVLEHGGSVR